MHCTIAREMIEKSIESDGATNKLDLSIFFFSSFASFQIIFFAGPFFRSRSDHGHTYTRRMMEIHWQTHALLVFRIRGSFFRVSFGDCQTEIHNAKIYSRPKKDSTEKKKTKRFCQPKIIEPGEHTMGKNSTAKQKKKPPNRTMNRTQTDEWKTKKNLIKQQRNIWIKVCFVFIAFRFGFFSLPDARMCSWIREARDVETR